MLSLGVRRGSLIQIGNDPKDVLEVLDVTERTAIRVAFRGDVANAFTLTDLARTEIMPNVFIQCGLKPGSPHKVGLSRIGFEAPEEIRIQRVGYALQS